MTRARKVLFLEFNEITRRVIDPLIAAGELPNFKKLFDNGTLAAPESVDQGVDLDPWITWVTVHTGVDRREHGARVLEQSADQIRAKRVWDYVEAAGRSVGLFGSISAYPPRPVNGYMIPGPFAPGPETYPAELQPVQALNRMHTRAHNKIEAAPGLGRMIRDGLAALRHGLRLATCARIAAQLLRERVQPHSRWKRICLQPLINFDFFRKLYREHRPDFATWHTNHCAHYMHHYWRAWDDGEFPVSATEEEKRRFGDALPYGYRIADELLGRFMRLIDEDTVLVLASSMGQVPYVSEEFERGRYIVRIRDINDLLAICGTEGVAEAFPTMAPQWNLVIPDETRRAQIKSTLETAYRVNQGVREPAFSGVEENGNELTITPRGAVAPPENVRVFFPEAPGAEADGFDFDSLFVSDAPTPKQGRHHPTGLLCFYGTGVAPGGFIENTTNLDVAPTVLSLLGVEVPAHMKGRSLADAVFAAGERAAVTAPKAA